MFLCRARQSQTRQLLQEETVNEQWEGYKAVRVPTQRFEGFFHAANTAQVMQKSDTAHKERYTASMKNRTDIEKEMRARYRALATPTANPPTPEVNSNQQGQDVKQRKKAVQQETRSRTETKLFVSTAQQAQGTQTQNFDAPA